LEKGALNVNSFFGSLSRAGTRVSLVTKYYLFSAVNYERLCNAVATPVVHVPIASIILMYAYFEEQKINHQKS
jgi:hypothetical protein